MNQAAGADDFFNTTIIECLANDISPICKSLAKSRVIDTNRFSNTLQNATLNFSSRIFLLQSYRETFKECFIKHIGANEAAVVRTLTFGVCSSNHIKTSGRFDKLTNLLQKDTFTFQNRLKAENLVGSKVNLIQQKDCTTLQCLNHRAIVPGSFTIHKTETTDQIILVSLNRDVDANQFTLKLSTRLFHRERFTVTRKTRNERRIEKTGLNNFFNIVEITKLDEGIIFIGNKVLLHRRNCSRSLKSTFNFINFLLSDFQVPLATTNFKAVKSFGYRRIGKIF